MSAVQLPLFNLDRIEGHCPRCGHRARLAAFVPQRREAVLADPRVRLLPRATRDFLAQVPEAFLSGQPTRLSLLADCTGYSPAGTHYQLSRLVDSGVVQALPKRPGSRHHLYQLLVLAQNSEKIPKI